MASNSEATVIQEAGDQAPDQKQSLNTTETLGSVDHASFKQATTANDQAKSTDQLPEVAVPVALDKNVEDAHAKLATLADQVITDKNAQNQFKTDLDSFEKRADTNGLTAAQVQQTYDQVGLMLKDAPNSPLTAAQRVEISSQLMAHLADPTSTTGPNAPVEQGWHDTCGWDILETRLLTQDPDKMTAKIAEAVTTGGVTTYDAAKIDALVKAGTVPDQIPTKVLKLDPASLQPDQEASGQSEHKDNRPYVDQIAQVLLDNMSWDSKTTTPTNEKIAAGSMQYEQAPTIARPSDAKPGTPAKDESGESVDYIDPETHKKVDFDASGYGFGGAASSVDMSLVNSIVTGRAEQIALQRPTKGAVISPESAISVNSVEDLKEQLQQLKAENKLPFPVFVEVDNPGIMQDYLARHPEKNASQVPKASWHVIAVTDIDSQGNVDIYNPWGIKRTMPDSELFEAMGLPGQSDGSLVGV